MAQDSTHLIWIDMEMSGLSPETDTILEVALVVTTQNLELVAEGPVRVVHQSDAVLDGMDNWNKSTHARSGIGHALLGSVAAEVLRRSPAPVLMVRQRASASGGHSQAPAGRPGDQRAGGTSGSLGARTP